jgi:hypothetical protein
MRKVDPFYLFDAKMRPLSSYEAMEKRIKLLETQLVRALRLIRLYKQKNVPDIGHEEHRTLN